MAASENGAAAVCPSPISCIDWDRSRVTPDVFLVKTAFDPLLNVKTDYKVRDREDQKRFTLKHRSYATGSQSKICETPEAFRKKVSDVYDIRRIVLNVHSSVAN